MAIKCWHVPALETVLFSRTENRTQRILSSRKKSPSSESRGESLQHFQDGTLGLFKNTRSSEAGEAVMKWVGEAKAGSGPAPAARGGHAGVSVGNSCYFFGGADR